jgi:ATPase subunit of ABC transporter with duplicated ATPase domains
LEALAAGLLARVRELELVVAQQQRVIAEQADRMVKQFGLRAGHVLRCAATLSSGEHTQAALALLQARGANLPILDEPTNHLDLPAIEQLESALATYPGTLLLVTHDRRIFEAVQTNRRIDVDCGQVTDR